MKIEECLFESKVDQTRKFIPVIIFWLFGSIVQGILKQNLFITIFLLLLALGGIWVVVSKKSSYELLAYKTYFTFKEGSNIQHIEYLNIDSVNINKSSRYYKIRFQLADKSYVFIPKDSVKNLELFQKIFTEKIQTDKIYFEN